MDYLNSQNSVRNIMKLAMPLNIKILAMKNEILE